MNKQILASVLIIATICSTVTLLDSSDTSQAGSENMISVNCNHGTLTDVSDGSVYSGGLFTKEITLEFEADGGYEFVSWSITGNTEYTSEQNKITIKSVSGNATISVNSHNYSSSLTLLNTINVEDLAQPGEDLVLSWSFKSTLLDMSGGMWVGMPSTPLIVEDYVYVRAGGKLYQLDMDSGTVVNYVQSGTGSDNFYHYLSYGNGIIFDTIGDKAYDLNLNYVYDIPSNLVCATYSGGYFYGFLYNSSTQLYSVYKTSADADRDLDNNVKMNLFSGTQEFHVFAQYGQFSNMMIIDDWMFFLDADRVTGTSGYRAITAFNLKTEKSVTCELTGFTGMPWDDGWLTYYNGYFYLTAYTAGLFDGVIKGLEDKRSSLMWLKFDFDKGQFEEPSYKNIQTPDGQEFRGIASGLVIYNGRGYLNVRALGTDTLGGSDDSGSKMIAYEIGANGEPIPKSAATSVMTHGGIVINSAYEDEGKIYIYMIPYNSSGQAVFVFTDELVNGEWVLKSDYDRLEMTRTAYCSQCIRAGPNGELIFYVDSGYIDCYISSDKYKVNVITVDGTYAKSETGCGKNVEEILKKLYPSITIDGKNATIGSKNYSIYGLNEVSGKWVAVTSPSIGTYSGYYKNGITESTFRQIVLLEQSSSITLSEDDGNGWYYFDGGYIKMSFSNVTSLRAAEGRSMFYFESGPSDETPVKTNVDVNRGSSVSLEIPDNEYLTFSVSDESIISVTKNSSTLTITGLKENVTTISIEIPGKQYAVSVNVLPVITVVDGVTKITSEKERVTEDGNTVFTSDYTEKSDTRTDRTVKETTKDSSGNVISERNIIESTYKEYTMDGQEAEYVTKTEKLEEGGILTQSVKYLSETITIRLDSGAVKTGVTEATEDKLAKTRVITTLEKTEYDSYSTSEKTIQTYTEGSDTPNSTTTETDYESRQSDFEIARDSDSVEIVLDSNGTVDVTELIKSLSEDTSVNKITLKADTIVNAKSVSSAADNGVEMKMDADVATITLSAETLKNLATAGGTVKFSAEANTELTPKQQSAAGGAKVFAIELTCGDTVQHEFGKFTMEIACEIEIQEDNELKVWRIDDFGEKTYAENVQYNDGKVSFDADHLSIYAIGYESKSADSSGFGSNAAIYIGICAIALLTILGAVALRRKHAL